MDRGDLKAHIRTLATLPETDAPVVSCFLGVARGRPVRLFAFEERVRNFRDTMNRRERQDFENAVEPIRSFISAGLLGDSKGAAIFSCAGGQRFFLPLQFHVPLPDWVAVDTVPNIYHLIELRDTYDRYVVVLCSKEDVRIAAVNLGTVTKVLWKKRPELRKRLGREWTKPHYQKHRGHHRLRFFREQAKLLEKLVGVGGYSHLILAGHPAATSRMREVLPNGVAARVVARLPASSKAPLADVVEASISAIVALEEQESQAVAEKLVQQRRTGGLATVGTNACLEALRQGRADVLVVTADYSPAPLRTCKVCHLLREKVSRSLACPECGGEEWREFDPKEEMVRFAERTGCGVEVVNQSDALTRLGGVGCFLRFSVEGDLSPSPEARRVSP
jgi:hypothetical protein